MPLKDLIVDQKQISEELLEKLLKDRIELIKEDKGVNLTKVSNSFSNKTKILLYLCGKKAWEFLDAKEVRTSPKEMEKNLGIKGNTLRPILKTLKNSYQVDTERGKYKILPKGVFELEKHLEYESKLEKISTSKIQKQGEPTKRISKSSFINKLYNEGFFREPKKMNDIITELKKIGVPIKSTSLPSYLLPLVRKRKLIREQVIEGKRKIWVYKLP